MPYSYGDMICEAIFDRPRGRFVLMTVGWDKDERVHFTVIHIDIVGASVDSNRQHRLRRPQELKTATPKSDIVLAFHPAEVRDYAGYAVA